eukprot:gene5300-7363_t
MSSFDERLNKLGFEYENVKPKRLSMPPLTNIKYRYFETDLLDSVNSKRKINKSSPQALCYENVPRYRGCEPLLNQTQSLLLTSSMDGFLPLPCIVENTCPYVKFRCNKGHMWNAKQGMPACFKCPLCNIHSNNRVYGIKNPRKKYTSSELISLVNEFAVNEKKGNWQLFDGLIKMNQNYNTFNNHTFNNNTFNNIKDFELTLKSELLLQCNNSHEWFNYVNKILHYKSWCKECAILSRRFSVDDYYKTAQVFNGTFLHMIDNTLNVDKTIKAVWKCEHGHNFVEYINNIRRKTGTKRKCSWCPKCRKSGIEFNWNESAA